jgi:nucleotide-binding universal stress UspA family protein
MTHLRTLLAATDLSAPARRAAARAALLAAEQGARLALAHVLSVGALDSLRQLLAADPSGLHQRLLDEVREELERLAAELQQRYGIGAEVHLVIGAVLAEIAGRADAIDADLIVIGARGAGFMRELLLGSTTERLLRTLSRPVLVVKEMPHEPYRRVLVPVDFSPRAADALRLATAVAPQAEIVLLHAFEVPFEGKLRYAGVADDALAGLRIDARREATQRMNELVRQESLGDRPLRRIVVHGEASGQILELEQEQDCDLIVIGKHGQGALEELLLGSVTQHVLARSTCDVLVADRPPG